jgi:transposase
VGEGGPADGQAPRREPVAVGEDHADEIPALVAAERPDWTLEELVAALHRRRLPGSRSALWRFFERHSISFKKCMARPPPVCKQFRVDVLKRSASMYPAWVRSLGLQATMGIRASRSS